MTTFVFMLTVTTGSDEFWKQVEQNPEQPDVNMLKEEIKHILEDGGIHEFELKLKSMTVDL